MPIIVETGAVVAGANSYATVAELRAYALNTGAVLPDDDLACEALLARAMQRMQGLDYKGERATRDQSLDWPRIGVVVDGFYYSSLQIPAQIKESQMAFAVAAVNMDLMPSTPANTAGPVISRTVGPISTTYANIGATRRTPIVVTAEQPLAKVLRHSGIGMVRG
jgi:hypothetical protein